MYGSGVLSFFVFLKSLFALNIILSILLGLFVIAPQAAGSGQYSSMLASLMSSEKTNASGLCSEIYAANLSSVISSGASLARFLDVIQGTHWSIELSYKHARAYLAVTGAAFFISMLFMLERKLARLHGGAAPCAPRPSVVVQSPSIPVSHAMPRRRGLEAAGQMRRCSLIDCQASPGEHPGSRLLLCGAGFAIYQAQKDTSCGVGVAPGTGAPLCTAWEAYVGQAFLQAEITFFAVIVWFGMLFCPFLPRDELRGALLLFYLRKDLHIKGLFPIPHRRTAYQPIKDVVAALALMAAPDATISARPAFYLWKEIGDQRLKQLNEQRGNQVCPDPVSQALAEGGSGGGRGSGPSGVQADEANRPLVRAAAAAALTLRR
uniref:Innexin n=1 Tax=Macrostomum lignano TaxID=282301 RepID=A0A1I8FT03_9PLAT